MIFLQKQQSSWDLWPIKWTTNRKTSVFTTTNTVTKHWNAKWYDLLEHHIEWVETSREKRKRENMWKNNLLHKKIASRKYARPKPTQEYKTNFVGKTFPHVGQEHRPWPCSGWQKFPRNKNLLANGKSYQDCCNPYWQQKGMGWPQSRMWSEILGWKLIKTIGKEKRNIRKK